MCAGILSTFAFCYVLYEHKKAQKYVFTTICEVSFNKLSRNWFHFDSLSIQSTKKNLQLQLHRSRYEKVSLIDRKNCSQLLLWLFFVFLLHFLFKNTKEEIHQQNAEIVLLLSFMPSSALSEIHFASFITFMLDWCNLQYFLVSSASLYSVKGKGFCSFHSTNMKEEVIIWFEHKKWLQSSWRLETIL